MSKEEAIEILSDMRCECNLFGDEEEATRYHALSWAIQAIKAEPVKHGRWIKITQEWVDDAEYLCSCCGRKIKAPSVSNPAWAFPYCHCGAKMDGTNKSVESVDLGNGFSISVNKSQVDTQGRYCPECLYSPTCYGAGISKPACKAFVPRVRYVDGKDGGEE